jgi:hypothetical protein
MAREAEIEFALADLPAKALRDQQLEIGFVIHPEYLARPAHRDAEGGWGNRPLCVSKSIGLVSAIHRTADPPGTLDTL